ncbi:MAG TPA: hypothetical protein VIL70_09845, partial [Chthoniobacterales bacterium]
MSRLTDHSFLSKLSFLLLAVLLAAPVKGASSSRPKRVPQNLQFEALPLERSRQNHLLVRVEINGKRALLGVDTGAPVSAIALSRRRHFGLTAIPGSSKLPARLRING